MSDRLERQLAELNTLRAVAVAELRAAFVAHGYDVGMYADDALRRVMMSFSPVSSGPTRPFGPQSTGSTDLMVPH